MYNTCLGPTGINYHLLFPSDDAQASKLHIRCSFCIRSLHTTIVLWQSHCCTIDGLNSYQELIDWKPTVKKHLVLSTSITSEQKHIQRATAAITEQECHAIPSDISFIKWETGCITVIFFYITVNITICVFSYKILLIGRGAILLV